MKPRKRRRLMLGSSLFVLVLLTACPPRTGISGVTIEAPAMLASGETVRLEASVQGRGSFNPAVSWSAEGGGTFSDTAANPVDYTAPEVSTETTVRVKATAVGDPSKSVTKEITVRPPEPFSYEVDPEVTPGEPTVPDKDGNPQPVAASRDEDGVQSDFVVGHVLIKPKSESDLTAFVQRYDGVILGDNSIVEPPANLGIVLTPEERKATEYLVKINLSTIDVDGFAADATSVGMSGFLEISSEDGLLTLAGATNALAAGYEVSPNYLAYATQAFPMPLFGTEERPDGSGGFANAFDTSRFQSSGSQSNVTLAWQFVAAHGIQRRVWVAIIDDGFWLNPNGTPRGADHDFPTAGPGTCVVNGITAPCQYDFVGDDFIADGAARNNACGAMDCFWHGTGAAGVATGILNNRMGAAGTGGLIADPMLFKANGDRAQLNRAIRNALAWGADIISMSFGGDCDSVACRRFDRNNHPFRDAVGAGSRAVFVAAAGNSGHEVGHPYYVHPCIMDHVICVGAVSDDGNVLYDTAADGGWKSNFGDGVDIYAPTNIPVMSRPANNDRNPNGTPVQGDFSGTSASAPFVAGVVAMMKAINPELSSDEVSAILRDTAHRGTAPVTHYIDAYAAVRKAAEGLGGVKDRFEPNGPTTPTQLSGVAPWVEPNLNLHTADDRDYYRFLSSQRATVRVDLAYPETLGQIPWLGLDGSDACGVPVQTRDAPLAGGGRRLEYTVAAGSHVIGLGGGLVNAYNLSVSFLAAANLTPDGYEPNNRPADAKHLFGLKPVSNGSFEYFARDARFTITANLHTPSDVDYYTLRGAEVSLAEQVLLNAVPIVRISDNESPVTLEVFHRNADGSPGTALPPVSSASCGGSGLSVALESGKDYIVKVSGGVGRYTLHNGVGGEERRLPVLVRDRVYEVLNPLDPVIRVVHSPLIYVLIGDKAFSEVSVLGALHLALYDFDGALIAEGVPRGGGFDETLSLGEIRLGQLYALAVTPNNLGPEGTTMSLDWHATSPLRASGNLLQNPGAEDGPGSDDGGTVDNIPGWYLYSDFVDYPTVLIYGAGEGFPTLDDPGPEDRGAQFFAGGPGTVHSGLRQDVAITPDWRTAVDAGTVKFDLSAFLGGYAAQADSASVILTFLDGAYAELVQVRLGPVTPLDREDTTGLWPRGDSGYLPPTTRLIWVDLDFVRAEGHANDGYADALELVLLEYAP